MSQRIYKAKKSPLTASKTGSIPHSVDDFGVMRVAVGSVLGSAILARKQALDKS